MRTNTVSFRKNAFDTLRVQGLSSAKAHQVSEKLASRLKFRESFPEGTEIRVTMDAADAQRISLVKDGIVLFCLDYVDLEGLQPLVDTNPTERQVELHAQMMNLTGEIYTQMNYGEAAYASEYGEPHTEGDYDAERRFVKDYAPYKEVLACYEAAKAESLAINPHVSASISDPERASFWYEWHRDAYNYRPTGFRTLAMIDREMETMPKHIDEAA